MLYRLDHTGSRAEYRQQHWDVVGVPAQHTHQKAPTNSYEMLFFNLIITLTLMHNALHTSNSSSSCCTRGTANHLQPMERPKTTYAAAERDGVAGPGWQAL